MAKAAKDQTATLGGQWMLLTGNMQKAAGAATAGLAKDLEKNVLPAANRASQEIGKIFGKEGLSNEEKLRQARAVIRRELGPVADDLKEKLDEADIPEHLGISSARRPVHGVRPRRPRRTSRRRSSTGGCTRVRGSRLATALAVIAKKGVDARPVGRRREGRRWSRRRARR
jgi:hypothetical protein